MSVGQPTNQERNRMKTVKKCKKPLPCKCRQCGAKESLRKIGRLVVTNISHALGLCGDCVGKQAGLV